MSVRWLWGLAAGGLAYAAARRGQASRIVGITRVVADLDRAEAFYRDGLGFRRIWAGPGDPAPLGQAEARLQLVVMRLGREQLTLARFEPAGEPYPAESRSNDCWFQHIAIVVSDVGAAYARLMQVGCTPISTEGPEVLPPRNGEVTGFKFRDPDGHPVELLHFPKGQGRARWHHRGKRGGGPCLGIDHSAMSVSNMADSLAFYAELGFEEAENSWNYGPAQAAMDGLPGAAANINGLRPGHRGGPGLELLGYVPPGRALRWGLRDQVTDWVTIAWAGPPGLRRDPDGHCMLMVPLRAARRAGR